MSDNNTQYVDHVIFCGINDKTPIKAGGLRKYGNSFS